MNKSNIALISVFSVLALMVCFSIGLYKKNTNSIVLSNIEALSQGEASANVTLGVECTYVYATPGTWASYIVPTLHVVQGTPFSNEERSLWERIINLIIYNSTNAGDYWCDIQLAQISSGLQCFEIVVTN